MFHFCPDLSQHLENFLLCLHTTSSSSSTYPQMGREKIWGSASCASKAIRGRAEKVIEASWLYVLDAASSFEGDERVEQSKSPVHGTTLTWSSTNEFHFTLLMKKEKPQAHCYVKKWLTVIAKVESFNIFSPPWLHYERFIEHLSKHYDKVPRDSSKRSEADRNAGNVCLANTPH